jgi:hypothetical protein
MLTAMLRVMLLATQKVMLLALVLVLPYSLSLPSLRRFRAREGKEYRFAKLSHKRFV